MKTTAPIIALIIVCLGLGVALVARHRQAKAQKDQDEARILQLSNEWQTTSAKLTDQVQRNTDLTNTVQTKNVELDKAAKDLADVKATLDKAQAAAKAAAETIEATKAELTKRDARIAELEAQNQVLDKRATDLKGAIGGLESKIADTEKKLAASEGDREFLLKELKRLQAEKAELERKFNDLMVLKEQVAKLKEELAVSRRLDWIKRGIYGTETMKGGPLLQRGFGPSSAGGTNFNLNVEVKRDGSATVTSPTNAPAPKK